MATPFPELLKRLMRELDSVPSAAPTRPLPIRPPTERPLVADLAETFESVEAPIANEFAQQAESAFAESPVALESGTSAAAPDQNVAPTAPPRPTVGLQNVLSELDPLSPEAFAARASPFGESTTASPVAQLASPAPLPTALPQALPEALPESDLVPGESLIRGVSRGSLDLSSGRAAPEPTPTPAPAAVLEQPMPNRVKREARAAVQALVGVIEDPYANREMVAEAYQHMERALRATAMDEAARQKFIEAEGAAAAKSRAKAIMEGQDPTSVASEVNPAEHINMAKFALDPDGEKRLAEQAQEMAVRYGFDPKRVITWDETRRIAAQLGLDPEELLRVDAARMTAGEMLAARNIIRDNTQNIEVWTKILHALKNDPVPQPGRIERIERMLEFAEAQNQALLGKFSQARSQAGRDLNSLKILANQTTDPVVWLTRAERMVNQHGVHLNAIQMAEIERLARLGDKEALAGYVAKLREYSVAEKGASIWKAGLLSAPATHIANQVGNATMAATESVAAYPAKFWEMLISGATGITTRDPSIDGLRRSMTLAWEKGVKVDMARAMALPEMKAAWRSARSGESKLKAALKAFREANPMVDQFKKWDQIREVQFKNPVADLYTKTIFRALGAGDKPWRALAFYQSLFEQSRILAKKAGIPENSPDFARRVEELFHNPTPDMVQLGIHHAEEQTFNDNTLLASLLGSLKGRARGTKAEPVLEVLMPFSRVPANVATRVAEYTPVGAIMALSDLPRLLTGAKKGTPLAERMALQRKIVNRLGRATVGAAPLALGYYLAQNGMITTSFPKDPKERAAFEAEGRQENSVLIGGAWHSIEKLGPFGHSVLLGAHFFENDQNPVTGLGAAVASTGANIMTTVSEQSALMGLKQGMEMADGEKGAGTRFAHGLARSVVPNFIRKTAVGVDPYRRETNKDELIAGGWEAMATGIPGYSSRLPEKVDSFGRPIENPGVFNSLLNPFYSKQDRTDDPLIQEFGRVGAAMQRPKQRDGETKEQYRAREMRLADQQRRKLLLYISSSEYQNKPRVLAQQFLRNPALIARYKELDEELLMAMVDTDEPDFEAIVKEIQRVMLEKQIGGIRAADTRAQKPKKPSKRKGTRKPRKPRQKDPYSL